MSSDLKDISTVGGYLRVIWFRWKYTLLLTLLGITVIVFGSLLVENYALKSSQQGIPPNTFIVTGSKLTYHGNESKFDDRYFDPLPDLPTPEQLGSSPINSIEIKWVRISGPNFTAQLQPYASQMRVIHLDNITIGGHLQPLLMPRLKEFYLNQGLEPEERNAPDYVLARAPTPWMASTLFFLNDSTSSFDTLAARAYEKNINVTVYLKGSVAYQMNPAFNEVRMDISNCSGLLNKLPKTYKILTLGRCKDLTPTIINPDITFLNFYIVYVTNELLSGILRNLRKLEEFYAEIPDGPIDVYLDDFSPTLKILSVSSMRIIPGVRRSYPNIKEFYFGALNQYGWLPTRITMLNQSLYENFPDIFPNVEKVGLFDVQDLKRYLFLNGVLHTPSAKWILVEKFGRGKNSSKEAVDDRAFEFVENRLKELGLPEDATDFLIEKNNFKQITAREISEIEKLWYRYTYLGWCPIDSWPKYLYVQRIISNGGILI